MTGRVTFLRGLASFMLQTWATIARSNQDDAAHASHKARYDLFRALGYDHAAALRAASGDEP
ncbi:hypothetical protein [Xanthobacter autotrophicus]|uniref:hypothetical protein n=1 Tax=Xanthobacter autotrophicus TaxID=280 RepID=UPI003726EBAF